MAPNSRRSTLQTEILAALATGPANSISALAKSLEKSRPSVSRSIKKLAEAGLTEKQGPTWQLTSMGQKEAELATRALHTSTKEVVEIAGKKFRAVTGIHERLVRDLLNIGEVMPSIANFTIIP
ncbi:MAG: ArsR family transcriptional regulator, partial [Chloroflexia bacterium]|nr:ArsR family transcriptional regulator [Chloroflexia bacterium]